MRTLAFVALVLFLLPAGASAAHAGHQAAATHGPAGQGWVAQLAPDARTSAHGAQRVQQVHHVPRRERRGLLQRLFAPRDARAQRAPRAQRPARAAARPATRSALRQPPAAQRTPPAATQPARPQTAALAPRPAPAAPPRTIDPKFLPAVVDYETEHEPGTIVVDTGTRYLYLVLDNGKAQRYGIGVGRDGFGWKGTVRLARKAQWPTWTPPPQMIKREPWLARYSGGMPGGPNNPLGARALYLFEGDRDTLYRIHGTNEPWTIGRAVSSGCFRMRNEDVKDLYERVAVGAKVVVL